MSSTALGVVAGVVVFAIGGLHGLLVLAAAVAFWWFVRAGCSWLLVRQNKRAHQPPGVKQRTGAGTPEQRRTQTPFVVRRRFTLTLILLLFVVVVTLAPNLVDQLATRVTAQRAISPLAAFGWLLMVLAPAGLAWWVFIAAGRERGRRQAAQQQGAREREEAQRREGERKAEEERNAEERRRRQAEQAREAERLHQQQREAKQLEAKEWWSVLEVSPRASAAEIRRAYYRKIKQCHPDRVAGLAPDFIDLAEKHTRTLNAAYDEATRACGGAEMRQG
jgi:DnaJ-domain-containing protein 1